MCLGTLSLSLIRAAMVAALMFFLGACASGNRQMRPCYEARATVTPPPICAGATGDACEERNTFARRVVASTVTVHVTRYAASDGATYAAGTGAVIDDRGTVLTAEHVVRDALNGTVIIGLRALAENGRDVVRTRDVPMRVVAMSRDHDVALLRPFAADERMPPPLALRRAPLAVGDRLWHFGNVSLWAYGRVNGLDVSYDGLSGLTRVDFACRHGDSGGPFVTPAGEIVGVLVRKDGDGEGVGQTYLTPLATALTVLGY